MYILITTHHVTPGNNFRIRPLLSPVSRPGNNYYKLHISQDSTYLNLVLHGLLLMADARGLTLHYLAGKHTTVILYGRVIYSAFCIVLLIQGIRPHLQFLDRTSGCHATGIPPPPPSMSFPPPPQNFEVDIFFDTQEFISS